MGKLAQEDFLVLTPRYAPATKEILARKAVRLAAVYLLHFRARHASHPTGTLGWRSLAQIGKELTRRLAGE